MPMGMLDAEGRVEVKSPDGIIEVGMIGVAIAVGVGLEVGVVEEVDGVEVATFWTAEDAEAGAEAEGIATGVDEATVEDAGVEAEPPVLLEPEPPTVKSTQDS